MNMISSDYINSRYDNQGSKVFRNGCMTHYRIYYISDGAKSRILREKDGSNRILPEFVLFDIF